MTGAPFLTIGHSTRSLTAFIAFLCAQRVRVLADVRSVPRSRHNPQFVEEFLAPTLALAEIAWSPRDARDWGSFKDRLPAGLGYLDRLGVKYRKTS